MAGIIGKKGQFLRKIKHVSGAYLVKMFPTQHKTQRNGMLVIKHFNIYNCIKAVELALNKIVNIQTFQLDKSRVKYNMLLPEQKVIQSSVLNAKKVKHDTPKYRNKNSESIQTGITKVNDAVNETQNKHKTKTAEKASKNVTLKAEGTGKNIQTCSLMAKENVVASPKSSSVESSCAKLNLSINNSRLVYRPNIYRPFIEE